MGYEDMYKKTPAQEAASKSAEAREEFIKQVTNGLSPEEAEEYINLAKGELNDLSGYELYWDKLKEDKKRAELIKRFIKLQKKGLEGKK